MSAVDLSLPSKAAIDCGAQTCGMLNAKPVVDAGMPLLACPKCSVLRIPPENLFSDHVDPDPAKPLSTIIKFLFSMRMGWLGKETPAIRNKSVRYLDIGCGDGQFMSFLKQKAYTNLTGIEPDASRAANSRKRGLNIYSTLAEARASWPPTDYQPDLISVWHVLEHVDHPIRFLETYTPLLAQDGVMLVSVPNQKAIQTRLFGKYSAYPDYGRHVWYHDPSYLQFLNEALPGFNVSILRDRNYEYEIFAWVESVISAIVRDPCFVNRTLKKGEGGIVRKTITALGAGLVLPFAVLLAPISIGFGVPSTLTFAIRRKG